MENIEATKIESGRTVNTAKKIKLSSYSEVVKNWNEIVNSAIEKEINVNKTDAKPDLNIDSKPEWDLVNINSNEINAYAPAKPIRIIGRGVAQAKSSWDSFRQQNIYSDMGDNNEHDNIYKELKKFGYGDDFATAAEQTIDKPELTDDAENKENASTYTQDLSAIIKEAKERISSTSDDYEFKENPNTYTQDLSDIIRKATNKMSSSSEEDEIENQQTIKDLVRKALEQAKEKESPSTYTQDLSAIIREATNRMPSEDFEPVEKEETMSFHHNLEINDLLKYITKIKETNDELEHSIETIEERNKKMLNTYYGITDETRKYEAEALEKANKLKQMRESQQERLRMREEEAINEGRSIKSDWMAADERNLRAKQLNEQISAMMLDSSDYSQEEEVAYKKVA